MLRKAVLILTLLALPACAGGSASPSTTPRPSIATEPTLKQEFRRPAVQRESGLKSVIGQRANALLGRFGEARIDLAEGDARKLQFAGQSCVLDIYLYPLSAGEEPVATHVEARARSGGQDVDRARCMAEVSQR